MTWVLEMGYDILNATITYYKMSIITKENKIWSLGI
jgi:hypothetical protein